MKTVNLEVNISGLKLKNPLIAASGTYGPDSFTLIPPAMFGAICSKAITYQATVGNKPPRLFEVSGGLINRIGLQNPGVHAFLDEIYPQYQNLATQVVINVAGFTTREYLKIVKVLEQNIKENIVYEINVSCPNVEKGGIAIASHQPSLRRLLNSLRELTIRPLWVKLPPQIDLLPLIKICEAAKMDALVLANTYRALTIDKESETIYTGGLSGPAIRPLTLYQLHQARQITSMPLIGSGGVDDFAGLWQYLKLGAIAVQLGSALFYAPRSPAIILNELTQYLQKLKWSGMHCFQDSNANLKAVANLNPDSKSKPKK